MTHVPFLRAPPFPGGGAAVLLPGLAPPPAPAEIDRVFAAIREAQVGGCFWGDPGEGEACVIVRARWGDEVARGTAMLAEVPPDSAIWLAPGVQTDPWSLLPGASLLVAHGDDEWVALAVIAGVRVLLLSAGRCGAPDDDAAQLREIAAGEVLRRRYCDPFSGEDASVEAMIALLADWRRTVRANRGIVAACGFSWWKRREIARFLWSPVDPLRFFRSERRAIAHAARCGGAVAIWPSRVSDGLMAAAARRNVPLVRVEDGFVRSAGLGSNLVPPSSIAVDRRGIHYDPARPSDLEALLANAVFTPALLERAARLQATILAGGIGKYGSDPRAAAGTLRTGRRIVLVPGQVEDDMSVRLGGGGLSSNLELLRRVRAREPAAEIWFRPHPDVDAGHRKGAVQDGDALHHADRIVRGGGMASLLEQVDAVHVLTSLTGFEALLRGRTVICHGMPFYAGWGLTTDLLPAPARRGRLLTLKELIAGALILYPRYLDPVTGLPCPPETLIRRISQGGVPNRLNWATHLRRLQGYLMRRIPLRGGA